MGFSARVVPFHSIIHVKQVKFHIIFVKYTKTVFKCQEPHANFQYFPI